MTERQVAALRAMAERPQRIHPSTGRALERRGLASVMKGSPYGCRTFAITEAGKRVLRNWEVKDVEKRLESRLTAEQRSRRARALRYLEFTGEFPSQAIRQAQRVLAAVLLDELPVAMEPGSAFDGIVERHARVALEAVDARDALRAELEGTDAGILTSFEEWRPEPVAPEEAIEASTTGGVTNLALYRRKRIA